eukprot:gene2934-5766_t
MLELVAVRGLAHLALIKAGMSSAQPLAQGKRLVIETNTKLHMQADGEPWKQRKCRIEVSWLNRLTRRRSKTARNFCLRECGVFLLNTTKIDKEYKTKFKKLKIAATEQASSMMNYFLLA